VHNETNKAIRLITRNASPSNSDFSCRATSNKPNDAAYLKAKEGKVQMERKILCIE
jgi:hypothetical protein